MRDPLPYIDDALRLLANAAPLQAVDPPAIGLRSDWQCELACAFTYADGSRLDARLFVDCSGVAPVWIEYGFQYRDARGTLRARWDQVPHRSGDTPYPHVHLADGRVVAGGPPRLREVADLIGKAVAQALAERA